MADNEEKLVKMLKYVSEHNDFYKNRIKEYGIRNPLDITQWPVLTRKELQIQKENLLSYEYSVQQLTNQLYKLSSSGTSGRPIDTFWEPREYASSMLCLWRRRKKYYNISPNDKRIDFMLKYYNNIPDRKLRYSMVNKNVISVCRLNIDDKKVMAELFSLMEEYKPVWIQLSPSVMEMMINYSLNYGVPFPQNIKYIEFMSEVLTPSTRKKTNELLPFAQIANMYGSEEMNVIAYECPCGRMHVVSENVFVECIDDKKVLPYGSGDIIVTNLHNKANPLIRYFQGDKIALSSQIECGCGNTDKVITSLYGRVSAVAIVNKRILTTCDVSDIMLIVANKYGNPIVKYKFRYLQEAMVMVCYTLFDDLFENWKQEVWDFIRTLIQVKYGHIRLEFVDGDFDTEKYKHDLLVIE